MENGLGDQGITEGTEFSIEENGLGELGITEWTEFSIEALLNV